MTEKVTLKPGETCEGKVRFPVHECPNMKYQPDKGGMEREVYECALCGRRDSLYYDEMR